MNQFGGLQKTEMQSQSDCSTVITPAADTPMAATLNCSAAPERNLSFELGKEMRCGFGEDSKMTADRSESTAPCSETKAAISLPSLSDRLTPSLISAGLVKGIIPLSMRDASGQQTLDAVLKTQDGKSAEQPKVDF